MSIFRPNVGNKFLIQGQTVTASVATRIFTSQAFFDFPGRCCLKKQGQHFGKVVSRYNHGVPLAYNIQLGTLGNISVSLMFNNRGQLALYGLSSRPENIALFVCRTNGHGIALKYLKNSRFRNRVLMES